MTEDINTFSQTLMREHPEFRAHYGRAFTQYEEIRHLRGKLKPMTEAICQSRELAGGLCKYVDEIGSVCYDKA